MADDKNVYVRINLPTASRSDLEQLGKDPVKVPVVGEVTTDPATLARAVAALKTTVETREGQRGSWVEKNVTWRDLIGTQVVRVNVNGDDYTGTPQPPSGSGGGGTTPGPGFPPWPGYPPVGPPTETPVYGAPPAPTNVQAAGSFESVIVSWDAPTFSYFSHAEVWRNTADVLGSAVLIGTTTASIYSDTDVATGTDYWYWVRFVNKWDNTPGAYQGTAGVKATTGADIPYLLDQLTGQITQTQLDAALSGEIDQIDQLAIEISQITAGVSGAFDPDKTYYFDSTAEGWVADTAATVSQANGHLVVDSTGTTPSVKLQSDLSPGVNGSKYPVVKARIKRVSGSTWSGTLQWKTAGHGFSASYQSVLSDPSLAIDDYATIEWDMSAVSDWTSSTILNLRLEIGAASDDDFNIDWIATGRNAPGASVAMVNTEASERTAADAAEATKRETLAALVVGVANPTGNEDLADLTMGLVYQEKIARADAVTAVADDLSVLSTTVGGHTTTLSTHGSSINGLEAQYTVKIDNAGHISGYGLASTAVGATPFSNFGVRADQFYIAPPATASVSPPVTNLYDGYVWLDTSSGNPATYVRKYYDADTSTWSTTPQALPFTVVTTPTSINGTTVMPGVYMKTAYIQDGQITNAKIANLAVDNAKIASLDVAKLIGGYIEADRLDGNVITAKVASLSVAKITTGIVGGDFYSDNYASTGGTAGWAITKSGTAVFQNATVRGTVYADSGYFAGSLNSPNGNLGQINLYSNYAGNDWAYIRSNGKWLGDSVNGFVFSYYGPTASSFFDVRAGTSFIRMQAGPSSGGDYAIINFAGGKFIADSYGNVYARGNIEATSLKVDAAQIVNTLHIGPDAVTVPRTASYGAYACYPNPSVPLPTLDINSGNGGCFLSYTFSPTYGITTTVDPIFTRIPHTLYLYRNGVPLKSWKIGEVASSTISDDVLTSGAMTVTYVDTTTGYRYYNWVIVRGNSQDGGAGISDGTFFALGLKVTGS